VPSRRLTIALFVLALAAGPAAAQAPAPDLKTQIASLGSLDYAVRTRAARQIRRAAEADAVPALTQAVRTSTDDFVKYRALVLLTSFNERATDDLVRTLLKDPNDRLRQVSFEWLERHPDSALTDTLLGLLQTEQAEFVRPALVGAVAALGTNPLVQRALIAEAGRGLDFFRAAVIDELGEQKAAYAVDTIAAAAQVDGPLQEQAVLALGRIGGAKATSTIAALTKASGPISLTARAATCLAGGDCDPQIAALVDAASAQRAAPEMVRAAVGGLTAIASGGNVAATTALVNLAARGDSLREAAAVGFATVAVRQPDTILAWLSSAPENTRRTAMMLLKDGFDALEEDFGEEQVFAAARAAYWKAPEDSAARTLMASVIDTLEF
jgi:hypothetical protein